MPRFLAFAVIGVWLAAAHGQSTSAPDRSAIVGSWWCERPGFGDKVVVFHRDGSWGVKRLPEQRDEIDGRRWWLEGRNLMLRYRIDTGFTTSSFPIVSFSRDRFITDIDGYRETYRRLRH